MRAFMFWFGVTEWVPLGWGFCHLRRPWWRWSRGSYCQAWRQWCHDGIRSSDIMIELAAAWRPHCRLPVITIIRGSLFIGINSFCLMEDGYCKDYLDHGKRFLHFLLEIYSRVYIILQFCYPVSLTLQSTFLLSRCSRVKLLSQFLHLIGF